MKKNLAFATALIILAASCNTEPSKPQQAKEETAPVAAAVAHGQKEMIERGAYLVTVAGCNDCHTPKKMTAQGPAPDMDRMLSGHNNAIPMGKFDTSLSRSGQWLLFNGQNTAFAGPWGLSFAANLTPDETGLGNWSLENFRNAMMHGKAKGIEAGRPLLPPMPWPNYARMTEADIEAIYDFLRSIKPVANRVPEAIMAPHP